MNGSAQHVDVAGLGALAAAVGTIGLLAVATALFNLGASPQRWRYHGVILGTIALMFASGLLWTFGTLKEVNAAIDEYAASSSVLGSTIGGIIMLVAFAPLAPPLVALPIIYLWPAKLAHERRHDSPCWTDDHRTGKCSPSTRSKHT